MNTNRDLNYRLYIQKEEDFVRTDIHREYAFYAAIRDGDLKKVKSNFAESRKNFYGGKGILSDDPLRNTIYHLVVAAAMIARFCAEAGMGQNVAYTLSDIYIRRADLCRDPEEVIDLLGEMQLDFASRMRDIRKTNAISVHVRRSIDYIYENLNEPLTLEQLSVREKLNPSYFSRLFAKETGSSLKNFVISAKVRTVENMLKYSDFSISEIAVSLGYSSQSAMTAIFRRITGLTPKKYRDLYYDEKIDLHDLSN